MSSAVGQGCQPPAPLQSRALQPLQLQAPARPLAARTILEGPGKPQGSSCSDGFGLSSPIILTNPFLAQLWAGHLAQMCGDHGGPQWLQPRWVWARGTAQSPCGTKRGRRRLMKVKGRLLLRMAEFCPTLLSTCAAASSVRGKERSHQQTATLEDKPYPKPAAHHPCSDLPPALVP